MNAIDPIHKVEFSEEDVRAKYIDPSLRNSNWKDEQVNRGYVFTDGHINVIKNKSIRGKIKKADYVLSYKSNMPLAIIEAKKIVYMKNHIEHTIKKRVLKKVDIIMLFYFQQLYWRSFF